jgi:hypothetical protein
LYVVLYSPLQMAADLPENYEGKPAFQFIRDVAVDWDTTRVIDGRIGDYVAVARRERGGQTWFVGAITDEEGRTLDVPLSFLKPQPAVCRRDLCRWPEGELAGQSPAGHDLETHGDLHDAAARRAGAGGWSGNPHPAGEMTAALEFHGY